jgi:hypothetical protein
MQLIAVCCILAPDTAHRNLAIFTALAGAPLVLIRFLSIHQHIHLVLFSLPFALLINFGVLRMYCWCYRETVNLWMIQLRIRIIRGHGKGTQGYAFMYVHCFLPFTPTDLQYTAASRPLLDHFLVLEQRPNLPCTIVLPSGQIDPRFFVVLN